MHMASQHRPGDIQSDKKYPSTEHLWLEDVKIVVLQEEELLTRQRGSQLPPKRMKGLGSIVLCRRNTRLSREQVWLYLLQGWNLWSCKKDREVQVFSFPVLCNVRANLPPSPWPCYKSGK